MDPQCIFRGHDLVNCISHGSAVYVLAAMLSYYFRVSIYSPRAILVQDWSWFLLILLRLLLTIDCVYFMKCFGHQTFLLISHFRGHLLYGKMPPMHWKLSWNTYMSFSMKNLAQKVSMLAEHWWPALTTLLASMQLVLSTLLDSVQPTLQHYLLVYNARWFHKH